MATQRSLEDLINDPNVPEADGSLAQQYGRALRRGLQRANEVMNAPIPGSRELGVKSINAHRADIERGIGEFIEGLAPEAVAAAPGLLRNPEPRRVGSRQTAPESRQPAPESRQNPRALAEGRAAGLRAGGYLQEREELAPGVRRYGSRTADPSDVYVTVDANGNRVYTDDADFAAGQSRGRLTRRDLAPGMTRADADRTLNDPEGGFTYAPASARAVTQLRRDSRTTGGGSEFVERARREAELAQEIAAARAGTRDIDKRREADGRRVRRNVTGEDPASQIDPKVLIALERLNLDRDKFNAERGDKTADNDRADRGEGRDDIKAVSDILDGVQDGSIAPEDARDLLSALPGEAGQRGARSLRNVLLRRLLTQRDAIGLGSEETGLADISSLRLNPDGGATFVEPDSGFFDIGRELDLSPEELGLVYGSPEDIDAARPRELNRRLRRGY